MAEEIKTPPIAANNLTGMLVGRFVVAHRLGAGGMGQVYLAEDPTLKRMVAIKRAVHSQSEPADQKRFLKEAQRASALNHPNVGGVYDVVEYAGELWLVMEYVEGETLRRRMKQPISPEDFFTIALQCCDGLKAAHDKGIVHGDIKPENIMIGPGNRVKILDFGVARRAWRAPTADEVTRSVQTMKFSGGTPAYMAPEVLLQKPDDGRSDLFSLGLVFYEMLGGAQPFQSESLATTVAKIVHEQPPSLKDVPGPLASVVSRMMAKNPDERYPNAGAVADDLRRIQEGRRPKGTRRLGRKSPVYSAYAAVGIVVLALAGLFAYREMRHSSGIGGGSAAITSSELPQTKILAILPFTPIKENPKLTALGEGLVESLAAKLGTLSEDRAFEVVPPGNLQEKNVSTLADAEHMFGANLGLAVTLEPAGDLTKVSYVLQGAQGADLGKSSISVPASDVFSLESTVAEGAVKDLRLQLRPEEEAALKIHGTDRPEAYQYYLQARGYLLDHSKPENLDNAALMAHAALKLDPNFGMAKAVLGESDWLRYSDTKQMKWVAPAKKECDDAIKLGNAGASGHICLGLIDDGTGHHDDAISEFQLALGLEPSNEEAAIRLAQTYEHAGKIAEAEKAYQQAVQAHPNSRYSYNFFGAFYRNQNQYDTALAVYNKVVQIAPEWYAAYVNIGAIYAEMGQYEKAIEPLKKSISIRPSYPGYVNLGTAYFGLGQNGDAAAAFEKATQLDSQQYVTWGNLGEAWYYAGQKEKSVAPLRKAIELASAQAKVNPRDANLLSTMAGYYSLLGDRKSSLSLLNKALQYGRNDKDVLVDAASVYNQLGDTGLAIEFLAKMLQAGYTSEKIRSLHEFDNLANTAGYQQLMKSSRP